MHGNGGINVRVSLLFGRLKRPSALASACSTCCVHSAKRQLCSCRTHRIARRAPLVVTTHDCRRHNGRDHVHRSPLLTSPSCRPRRRRPTIVPSARARASLDCSVSHASVSSFHSLFENLSLFLEFSAFFWQISWLSSKTDNF